MLALILALTEEESHDALTFLYKKYARKMLKVAKSELSKWENIDLTPQDVLQAAFLQLSKNVNAIDMYSDESKVWEFLKNMMNASHWHIYTRRFQKQNGFGSNLFLNSNTYSCQSTAISYHLVYCFAASLSV